MALPGGVRLRALGPSSGAPTIPGTVGDALRDVVTWPADLVPGEGRTTELWELLATLGAADLGVARAVEPHLDARAILAQAGIPDDAGRTWGVFAAEGPGVRLDATQEDGGWRLHGTKPWCSLAGLLDAALVTAHLADGSRGLFAVGLREPGVRLVDQEWVSRGLAEIPSTAVAFDHVRATPVGAPGWYLGRPGFWWGGIGVAACWFGGAVGIGRRVHAQAHGRDDPLLAMHLGAIDQRLESARRALAEAAAPGGRGPRSTPRRAGCWPSGCGRPWRVCARTCCGGRARPRSGAAGARGGARQARRGPAALRPPAARRARRRLPGTGARRRRGSAVVTFDGRAPGTPADAWSADARFRDLPALALRRTGRTVVVAAHPDDETLGAGGILAELADAGHPAEVVVVSDGSASHPGSPTLTPDALVGVRSAEVREAVRLLSPDSPVTLLGHPDGGLREVRDAVEADLRTLLADGPPRRPARRPVARRRTPRPPGRRRGLRDPGRRARLRAARVPAVALALGDARRPARPVGPAPGGRPRGPVGGAQAPGRRGARDTGHRAVVGPARRPDAAPRVPADVRPGRRGRRRAGARPAVADRRVLRRHLRPARRTRGGTPTAGTRSASAR